MPCGGSKVPTFKVQSKTHAVAELPRFGNSRNVEMNSNISAAELNWRGQSALLVGIVLAGLFVYLFQTHPFEEFALNLEVIAITLGKVTEKAGRSAIAQGVDQCPNTVIYKISFAPNLCHNDCPRFVKLPKGLRPKLSHLVISNTAAAVIRGGFGIRHPAYPAQTRSSSTVCTSNSRPFGSWDVYACDEPYASSQDSICSASLKGIRSRFFGDHFAVFPDVDGSAVYTGGLAGDFSGAAQCAPGGES